MQIKQNADLHNKTSLVLMLVERREAHKFYGQRAKRLKPLDKQLTKKTAKSKTILQKNLHSSLNFSTN